MRYWPAPLVGLLGLRTGLAVAALGSQEDRGPMYTVAAVRAAMARDSVAWAGRTVRVRGVVEPCRDWDSPLSRPHCAASALVLVDPEEADLAAPLPLVIGTGDLVVAAIRRLPLAGRLLPPAPALPWETRRTFQVRLRAPATGECGAAPRFETVLLGIGP